MWAWVVWVRTLASVLAFIKLCWVAKVLGKTLLQNNESDIWKIQKEF
jgi:hypothetical protein